MLSKNKIKFINSLKEKKYRNIHKKFIIEGNKIILDILYSYPQTVDQLIATSEWLKSISKPDIEKIPEVIEADKDEIKKISSFKTAPEAVLVVKMPESEFDVSSFSDDLSLVLDTIQDPGNLGTIIRIADWFGIRNIICSESTADCYNPKVLQSSMGSIMRVKVFYTELHSFFQSIRQFNNCPVYGTFVDGEPVYSANLTANGLIVLGNESQGISTDYFPYIGHRLNIPPYKTGKDKVDSLNVAAATAIVCSEFRRRL